MGTTFQGTGIWVLNAGGNYPSFAFEDVEEGNKYHEVRDENGSQVTAGTYELNGNTINGVI